jgi:kumamolisin
MKKMSDLDLSKEDLYFDAKQIASIYGFPNARRVKTPVVVGVISFGGWLYGIPEDIPLNQPFILPPYMAPQNNIDGNNMDENNMDENNIEENKRKKTPPNDLHRYWASLGYTSDQMPRVIIYPVDRRNKLLLKDIGSTEENTLDVSTIGGCCPSANLTIILYIFPSDYSFSKVLPMALKGIRVGDTECKPTILSISWGAPENMFLQNKADTIELNTVNRILQRATQEGVNICVASGDNGSMDGTDDLSVDFPSGCPYLTSVGGTSLICPSKKEYDADTKETVWNSGILNGMFVATGGGISRYYERPQYQSNIQIVGNKRCVPDIAFNADPKTGFRLFCYGKLLYGIGGTSVAAPMFAAYLALFNPKVFVNQLLYNASKENFHDITEGTNYDSKTSKKKYKALPGYDCCTGLGSLYGNVFDYNLSAFSLNQAIE